MVESPTMVTAFAKVLRLIPPESEHSAITGMETMKSTMETPKVPKSLPNRISPGVSREVWSITKVLCSRSEVMALAVKPAVIRIMKVSSVPRKMVNNSLLLESEKTPVRGQRIKRMAPSVSTVSAARKVVSGLRMPTTNSRRRMGFCVRLANIFNSQFAIWGTYATLDGEHYALSLQRSAFGLQLLVVGNGEEDLLQVSLVFLELHDTDA